MLCALLRSSVGKCSASPSESNLARTACMHSAISISYNISARGCPKENRTLWQGYLAGGLTQEPGGVSSRARLASSCMALAGRPAALTAQATTSSSRGDRSSSSRKVE
eukprot:6817796-Pyramimonas_sp.AAC.1